MPSRPVRGTLRGMTRDAWIVVLIVFVTMFAIQAALFTWVEYLLHEIDLLDEKLGHPIARTRRGGVQRRSTL